jgi:Domain of unknown function DUF29
MTAQRHNLTPAGGHDRSLYDADEHEWIALQIAALQDGNLDRLDRDNLAEYLNEMTVRDRRELRSRLTVLLQHLLKVQLQPGKMSRSWERTILEQQREVRLIIEGIPSLGRQADAIAAAAYPDAVKLAARETGLPMAKFPAQSPWTVLKALTLDPPAPGARR